MADAFVIQLADAVKDLLNAATLSLSFTAERAYVPVFDLTALAAIKVTVVPRELSMATLSRRDDDFTYVIDVAVMKSIGRGDMTTTDVNAACDPLMKLTEEIGDLFRDDASAESLPARFVGFTNAPIFDWRKLDEERVFAALISPSFKLVRSR